jgi:histidinol dehydrogenase
MKILGRKQLETLLKGRHIAMGRAEAVVRPILATVRKRGDAAVAEYARRLDGYEGPLRVGPEEMHAAWKGTPAPLRKAMREAAASIGRFARLQKPRSWTAQVTPGVLAGQVIRPLASAGCYAPGGRFPLPSTVLMTAIPARVAGVGHIGVSSPRAPQVILAAAHLAGADAVYPIGGAHAIAAMAYGTKAIPRVERIVGPGNVYVTAAKRIVSAEVGIDFIAGPTEIVLVAESGNAKWIAADMIAQAEHDPAAVAMLLTPSRPLARKVAGQVKQTNCAVVVTRSVEEALELANRIAPEHLWLQDPDWVKLVSNAGSIFLGPYSPVAAGDYATGPNHTLPTAGGARLRGGLSVMDFVKVITVQNLTARGLARLAGTVTTLARAEGLEQHAKSIEVRSE